MTQEGELLTCDRCGDFLFVPKIGIQFNAIDGYAEESTKYKEHDPNWGYLSIYPKPPDVANFKGLIGLKMDFTSKLLCSKCRDEFTELMYKFWRIDSNA